MTPRQIVTDLHLVVGQPVTMNLGGVVTCTYRAGVPLPNVTVTYWAKTTIAHFLQNEDEMAAHQGEVVPDLGDGAYAFSGPAVLDGRTFTMIGLSVLKDSVQFQIFGTASLAQMERVAGQIIPKL